jgi:hypothetical protein
MTDNITLPRAYAKRLRGLLKIHEDPRLNRNVAGFAGLCAEV